MRNYNPEISIQEISFHRNRIGGTPFHAVRFLHQPEDADAAENFLATVFEDYGAVAVIGLDRIASQGVAFACGNSWRGESGAYAPANGARSPIRATLWPSRRSGT